MINSKKGQAMLFVILGLVIVVAVGTAYMIYSNSFAPVKEATSQFGTNKVEAKVSECLDDTLTEAVEYCIGANEDDTPICPDYENDVSDYIKTFIYQCLDFSVGFDNMDVDYQSIQSVMIIISDDKKNIKAEMKIPVLVKRRDQSRLIDTFVAEKNLMHSSCISGPVNMADCTATEYFEYEMDGGLTFSFNPGQKVTIGGVCVSCGA